VSLRFRTLADVAAAIEPVRRHLARGGLLAYPTETVYGLGSRALAEDVARLARLKGRQAGKPFLLLVSGRDMLRRYGLALTPAAALLADRYWPGPLTLVLPGGEGRLPDELRGPEGGIAVRRTWPD
jgi:L-threonylcarbamoyladenylate synthase